MLLLQTMVRAHISSALMAAQVIGSIVTIIARVDGLNSTGPGPTFPSIANNLQGLANAWVSLQSLNFDETSVDL